MNKHLPLKLVAGFLFAATFSLAQNDQRTILPVNYIFDGDSLKGFDEEFTKKMAFNDGFFGEEFKVYMYRAKRSFIDNKFHVPTAQQNFRGNDPVVAVANCVNEDFEASSPGGVFNINSVAGWVCTSNTNTGSGTSCTLPGCCVNNPTAIMICTNGYVDPTIGSVYPLYSVFGSSVNTGNSVSLNSSLGQMYGNNFIRINDNNPNFGVNQVSKTMVVGSSNNIFSFAWAGIYNNGHPCCDAGAFKLKLTNVTAGTVIATPSFSFSGINSACTPTSTFNYYVPGTTNLATTSSPSMYNPWQLAAIDLSPYTGMTIRIDFQACDCTGGAHIGYSYVDAQCSAFNFMVNSNPYPSGSNVNSCSTGSMVVSAPSYLGPYFWSGPGGFTSSNQTINPTLSGTYTLTSGPPGLVTSNVITLNSSPAPTVSVVSSNPLVCVGQSATLTVSGLTTFTWNTGATTANIVITPTASAFYSVNGVDTNSCVGSGSVFQGVSLCTGIANVTADDNMSIYPNPNNGEFTLNVKNGITNGELLIENTLGQVVHSQAIVGDKNKIKTKNLAQGIYYYIVVDNKNVVSKGKLKIE